MWQTCLLRRGIGTWKQFHCRSPPDIRPNQAVPTHKLSESCQTFARLSRERERLRSQGVHLECLLIARDAMAL